MSSLDEFARIGQLLQYLAKLTPREILEETGASENDLVRALGVVEYGSRFVRERLRPATGQITIGTVVMPEQAQIVPEEISSDPSQKREDENDA